MDFLRFVTGLRSSNDRAVALPHSDDARSITGGTGQCDSGGLAQPTLADMQENRSTLGRRRHFGASGASRHNRRAYDSAWALAEAG